MPEADMPFTSTGLCPDLVINPNCLVGDTVIRLANGEVKYIKDIYNKKENITTHRAAFNIAQKRIDNRKKEKNS